MPSQANNPKADPVADRMADEREQAMLGVERWVKFLRDEHRIGVPRCVRVTARALIRNIEALIDAYE